MNDVDARGAIASGREIAVSIHANDGGVAARVAGVSCHVPVPQRDEQLPALEGVVQLDSLRHDGELRSGDGERREQETGEGEEGTTHQVRPAAGILGKRARVGYWKCTAKRAR